MGRESREYYSMPPYSPDSHPPLPSPTSLAPVPSIPSFPYSPLPNRGAPRPPKHSPFHRRIDGSCGGFLKRTVKRKKAEGHELQKHSHTAITTTTTTTIIILQTTFRPQTFKPRAYTKANIRYRNQARAQQRDKGESSYAFYVD